MHFTFWTVQALLSTGTVQTADNVLLLFYAIILNSNALFYIQLKIGLDVRLFYYETPKIKPNKYLNI